MDTDRALPPTLLALPSYALSLAGQAARASAVAVTARADLRLGHLAVLAILADYGPSSQRVLASRLRRDPSDLVALLDDLESRGDARREPDPEDRRRRRVVITARGRRTLDRLIADVKAAEETVLGPLTPRERIQLRLLAMKVLTGAG
jgi:MarR family transcriptional regulator, lower aerobic nicotinate degradation pathway regulator